MKARKWITLALAGCISLSLAACGGGPAVYVQSVSQLMGYGGIAPGDRFGGMVVSEHVAEIRKDGDRTIAELLVQEGDDVKEGDPLFSYDTEELQLTLDKQRLELEQMQSSIENFKEQLEQLEKERKRVGGTAKLQYTVQIQTTEVELKETELKIKTKEAEVKKSEDILENATVTAPVTGRVQAINESGSGSSGMPQGENGEPAPYITIQKSGAYRIKGILGELQRGGITEGSKIKILSRTDPSKTWTGTVSLVDYENPVKDDGRGYGVVMMGDPGGEEMTAASRYPFYVKLDSTEGLLMGEHVYMELDSGEGSSFAVAVDGSFLVMEEDGSAYVWAENNHNKLEKRKVTLGEYNEMMNTYEITEGLTAEDYIAFPDPNVCKEGVRTSHEPVAEPTGDAVDAMPEGDMGSMGDMGDMEMIPEGDMGEMLPEGGAEMPAEGEMMPEPELETEAPAEVPVETAAETTEGGE